MEQYGILDGYEDGLEEDDEKGSRAIPSRTSLGCESSFIEKYPIFGGYRFGVRNFDYRWRLTLPQIEVMMSDLPHTLYNMANKKPKISDVEDAERKMREAYEKRRKEKEREGYTVEELFEGKELEDNS